MRAVFHINIPQNNTNNFPDDDTVRNWIRSFGWEPNDIKNMEDNNQKSEKHKELCLSLKSILPEIAERELQTAIFYGFISHTQTVFIITRANVGEIAFRVIHEEIVRLIAATEEIVTYLVDSNKEIMANTNPGISKNLVTIYEKGSPHKSIIGRVIRSFVNETVRINKKDFLVAILSTILLAILVPTALFKPSMLINGFFDGTVDRLSTALIATLLLV